MKKTKIGEIKKSDFVKSNLSPSKGKATSKETKNSAPRRPMWAGSISIGLINVPVKLYPMIYDRGIKFNFLHKPDSHPLRYEKICTKDGKVVPWSEVAKGYAVAKNQYIVFEKEELDAFKPESDRRIRIDKFVDFFSVDPVYFYSSYILMHDKSSDAYNLLFTVLNAMGKAGVGRITLRTKEYPALIHAYKGALVLTTMRYAYDVVDPSAFEELRDSKVSDKNQVEIAKKIIADLSGEFDITEYKDTYRQRFEELIQKKLKGIAMVVEKPPKEEVKELMDALQETLKQLEKK